MWLSFTLMFLAAPKNSCTLLPHQLSQTCDSLQAEVSVFILPPIGKKKKKEEEESKGEFNTKRSL